MRCDVSREPSVRSCVAAVVRRFGRLDSLVNNAGLADPHTGPLEKLPLARSARRPLKLSRADHAQHPAGRIGQPEDVAELVAYLLSQRAGFATGQNFVIDGGMTKKMIYV